MIRLPPWTSRSPEKRVLFGVDPYLHEAWSDLQRRRGPDGAEAWLRRSATLVLRPDSMAARVGRVVLDRVRAAGFVPVASYPVRFSRHIVREIWRHDLNGTPPDRLEWMDLLLEAADSLVVLLRDDRRDPGVSASERLRALKGSSEPGRRSGTQLRGLPGVGSARMLTYVHAADEPADVVRELGILLDSSRRREMLAAEPSPEALERAVASLAAVESETTANDLTLGPALQRLAERIAGRCDGRERAALLDLVGALRAGDSRRWQALLPLARADRKVVDLWDVIAVGAHACPPRGDRPAGYFEVRAELARTRPMEASLAHDR